MPALHEGQPLRVPNDKCKPLNADHNPLSNVAQPPEVAQSGQVEPRCITSAGDRHQGAPGAQGQVGLVLAQKVQHEQHEPHQPRDARLFQNHSLLLPKEWATHQTRKHLQLQLWDRRHGGLTVQAARSFPQGLTLSDGPLPAKRPHLERI